MKRIYCDPEAEQVAASIGYVLADSIDLPTDEEFEE